MNELEQFDIRDDPYEAPRSARTDLRKRLRCTKVAKLGVFAVTHDRSPQTAI